MFDVRPVIHIIGLVVAGFGVAMFVPMCVDLWSQNGAWETFLVSGFVTFIAGLCLALATQNAVAEGLTIKQTYLLITSVFATLPLFGAIPFIIGPADLSLTDAFFETMSGITTTGATVMTGLSEQHEGLLIWRGMLQWFGGISVIIVALAFLPLLRVGGMQLFRWDTADVVGNVLPRAKQISRSVSVIYLSLSAICFLSYLLADLKPLDAAVYTMTTIATGGFANDDSSFGNLGFRAEYVAIIFMSLAALPFLRYSMTLEGRFKPMIKDSQIRAFVLLIVVVAGSLMAWQVFVNKAPLEQAFRESLFNGVSILTGTGYVSTDYGLWGGFPLVVFFTIGLIGGCAGSTSCSIKIFRFQLLFAAMEARIKSLQSPHAIIVTRYEGKRVPDETVKSVMLFLLIFFATLMVTAALLTLSGLDFITSLSGAAAALANVGPGLGEVIGPSGNYSSLSVFAKWLLSFVMLIGRLELIAVYAVLTIKFWRK